LLKDKSNPMQKFYVMSHPYDDNSGGTLWLYRLVKLLNDLGFSAKIIPWRSTTCIPEESIARAVKTQLGNNFRKFALWNSARSNVDFPVSIDPKIKCNDIVVYPEIAIGNPYNASKVCRFFLHRPGYFNKKLYYRDNEFWIRGGHVSDGYKVPTVGLYSKYLNLSSVPEIYFRIRSTGPRKGTAYIIRKGDRSISSISLNDAISIDGLNHREIAQIFHRVERFISFDPYTAYSKFAALCGCDSIVLEQPGLSESDWQPDFSMRYGIAYGESQVEVARLSRTRLLDKIREDENFQLDNVKNFCKEVMNHFE